MREQGAPVLYGVVGDGRHVQWLCPACNTNSGTTSLLLVFFASPNRCFQLLLVCRGVLITIGCLSTSCVLGEHDGNLVAVHIYAIDGTHYDTPRH